MISGNCAVLRLTLHNVCKEVLVLGLTEGKEKHATYHYQQR